MHKVKEKFVADNRIYCVIAYFKTDKRIKTEIVSNNPRWAFDTFLYEGSYDAKNLRRISITEAPK